MGVLGTEYRIRLQVTRSLSLVISQGWRRSGMPVSPPDPSEDRVLA